MAENDPIRPDEIQVQPASRPNQPPKKRGKVPRFYFVLGGVLVLILLMLLFNRGPSQAPAVISKAPDVNQGNPSMTPEMQADEIKSRDTARAKAAMNSPNFLEHGGAVVPTVTREYTDPLSEYAQDVGGGKVGDAPAVQTSKPVTAGASTTQLPPAPRPHSNASKTMLEAIQKELDGTSIEHPATLAERVDMQQSKDGNNGENKTGAAAVADSGGDSANETPATPKAVLFRLGRLLYAAMDLEANSDSSSFVQATVQAGPFRGARVQGSFKLLKTNALELDFTTISWNNGTYRINAVGVNPDEPKVDLATDVNHHYITRYGGLFVTGAATAVAQTLQQEGNTSTFTAGGLSQVSTPTKTPTQIAEIGAGSALGGFSQLAQQAAARPVTVVVAARTPIGILFKSDWIDEPNKDTPDADSGDDKEKTRGNTKLPFLPGQADGQGDALAAAASLGAGAATNAATTSAANLVRQRAAAAAAANSIP